MGATNTTAAVSNRPAEKQPVGVSTLPAIHGPADPSFQQFLSRIGAQKGTALELAPVADRLFAVVSEDLTGGNQDVQAKRELEDARQKCRDGNPFPLVALQWPRLVIDDEGEAALFDPRLELHRFDHLPDYLLDVVLSDDAPQLRLDWWQRIVLAGFFAEPIGEINCAGATGCGKGLSVSLGICLWFDVFPVSRQHLTSRSFDHVQTNLFGEVRQWMRRMEHVDRGLILNQSIGDGERHYIKILNPSPSASTAGEAFSGAHGPNTLYVFDEASAVVDEFVVNAQKNAMKIVSLSNPRTLFGLFRDGFKPIEQSDRNRIGVCSGTVGMRLCVSVGGSDCANVRHQRLRRPVAPLGGIEINGRRFDEGEPIPKEYKPSVKPLIDNQIDIAQFRAICAKPDQREVDVFAHGKFPTEDPQKQVVMASWLQRHIDAWHVGIPVTAFGLDVARSKSGNETMLAAGGPRGLNRLYPWQKDDVIYHAEETIRIAATEYGIDLRKGQNPVCVDTDGLGGGTADMLKRYGVWVIEFHGGIPSPVAPRQYGNWRTEAYATLGRRLNPDDMWGQTTWALPPGDTALYAELSAPEKVYPRGDALRFSLSPKRKPQGHQASSSLVLSVEEKLGRSPDRGDAAVYLFVAVRIRENMNEFFAEYSGPLVYGSGESIEAGELTRAMNEEQKRENAATGNAGQPQDPAQAAITQWIGDLTGVAPGVTANDGYQVAPTAGNVASNVEADPDGTPPRMSWSDVFEDW